MARTHVETGAGHAPLHHVYTEHGRGRGAPSVVLLVPRESADGLSAALEALHGARGPLDLDRRLGALATSAPEGTGFLVAVENDVWAFPGGPFDFGTRRAQGVERIEGPEMFRLAPGDAVEIRDPEGELVAAFRADAPPVDPARSPASRAGPLVSLPRPSRGTLVGAAAATALVAFVVLGLPLLGRQAQEPGRRTDAYQPPSLEQQAVDLLTRGADGSQRSAPPAELPPGSDASVSQEAAAPGLNQATSGPGELLPEEEEAPLAVPEVVDTPAAAKSPSEGWSFRARAAITSSPRVHEGRIYFGSRDEHVYCLDARTGDQIWSHAAGSGVASSPGVGRGLVFVGTYAGNVLALDTATGERRWDVATGGKIVANPAVADGAVVLGSHTGSIHSFDAATGRSLWALRTGSPVRASAEAVGNRVVIGAGDGTVRCLTARGGQLVWEAKLPASVQSPAAAVADGRRVVVPARDGTVACFDVSTGRVRWRVQVGAEVNGRPAPAGDLVLIGTGKGALVALEVEGGAVRWTARAERGFDASPLVIGDLVVAPSYDGQVHVFGLADGAPREAHSLEAEVWAAPAVAGDLVLVGTLGGTMHALPRP